MEKTKIEQFYKQWQIVLPQRIDSYIYDDKGELLPTRFIVPLKSENDFFDVGGFPFIIKIENIQKSNGKSKKCDRWYYS
jgi:hypothetical protein